MMHDPGDMDRLWRLRAFEFLGRAVRGRGEVELGGDIEKYFSYGENSIGTAI